MSSPHESPSSSTSSKARSAASCSSPPIEPPSQPFSPARPALAIQQPQSIPISNKLSGTRLFSSNVPGRGINLTTLAREVSKRFLGPMPRHKFLDDFLPLKLCSRPRPDASTAFDAVASASPETLMYKPFIDAVKPFAPGLHAIDTHTYPDTACDKISPHVTVYSEKPANDKPTNFSKIEIWIEFKQSDLDDPFCDDKSTPFEKWSKNSENTKAQISSYAAAQMGTQFLVHLFSVLIFGRFARLVRWDRAGSVVTERFDYLQDPGCLADFFWRYAHADASIRGHDTSVSAPAEYEIARARLCLDRYGKDFSSTTTFVKLMVPGGPGANDAAYYIIPSPRLTARSPFGRATRPSIAYDIAGNKACYFKDYWRPMGPELSSEGEVYARLTAAKARNIATFIHGNDMAGHETLTHNYAEEVWAPKEQWIPHLSHYRMVLGNVSRDLRLFKSSWEMVTAVADAMEAHDDAYFLASILHRDISVSNIIITDKGRGLLIDWDMCVSLDRLGPWRQLKRTGTWQFIAVSLLQWGDKTHEIQDDRESALHVITWMALRYTEHDQDRRMLGRRMHIFDDKYTVHGQSGGGELKLAMLTGGLISKSVKFTNPKLGQLIKEFSRFFAVRYLGERPTEQEMEQLEQDLNKPGVDHSFLFRTTEYKYKTRMESMAKRGWLVEFLRRHLAESGWPAADGAVEQPFTNLGKDVSSLKRTSEKAALDSYASKPFKISRSDHDGSTSTSLGLTVSPRWRQS